MLKRDCNNDKTKIVFSQFVLCRRRRRCRRQVNFLDTAEMYPVPTKAETQGFTDRTIAAWLKQRGGASRRSQVVLASKVRQPFSPKRLR
jgi:aryl-alcohol dehydrogenase-like predicted oxidoreductase